MIKDYDADRSRFVAGSGLDIEARRGELEDAAAAVSAGMPGDQHLEIDGVDPVTGGASRVRLVGDDAEVPRQARLRGESAGPGPGAEDRDVVRRALEHVQRLGGVLGLMAGQPPEYVPDPQPQVTSGGGMAVHLQQQLHGIGVYDAAEVVRFAPGGRILDVTGRSRPVADAATLDPNPTVAPADALRTAVAFLASQPAVADDADETAAEETDPFGQPIRLPPLDVSAFRAERVTGPVEQPDRACVFTAEQLAEPATIRLLWFPTTNGLELSWVTVVALAGGAQFRVVVDAHDGDVLLSRPLVHTLTGEASLRLLGGGEPAEHMTLPLPLDRYPVQPSAALPAGFPDDWLLDATTEGANVVAVRVDTGATSSGDRDGDVVRFTPADPVDDLVVHLFAFNGLAHNLLYLVGFRERDGNFQRETLGRGGMASDAVEALVHPGPVFGTANMRTPIDGRPPQMNMGLVESTGRHTALDVDVVVHEYAHGLTNRLVGGPLNDRALEAIQSAGMGEGWSDYVACTQTDRVTVGAWVVGNETGIRGAPYTDDYPNSFADLGTGRFTRVHAIGEPWCATLLAMNRRVGPGLGLQLVVDGLKLTPPNPSFLDARDAIVMAAEQHAEATSLPDDEAAALLAGVWAAFARFGMGPAAQSDGPGLTGIVADFEVPVTDPGGGDEPGDEPPPDTPTDEVVAGASPDLIIPDDDPNGVSSTVRLDVDDDVAGLEVTGLEVSVEVEHTWQGDLVVTLTGPDGRGAILHDRTGGSTDDLAEVWDSDVVPALAVLLGGPADGDWTLNVADRAGLDTGTLRSWQVRARLAAGA